MKIIGIIVEYNPFHNGHLYQIDTIRKKFAPDGIIVVMSGNFVQRGTPSIYNKWLRSELAIRAGVDLVLELPTYYATASAEEFARGGVKTLIDTGIVTHLAFGSETEHLEILDRIATCLHDQPEIYKTTLKSELKTGVSYPVARAKALKIALPDLDSESLNAINRSNAILGIEYLKALKHYNSVLTPLVVKRKGADYNDLTDHSPFASASAIRELIGKTNFASLDNTSLAVLSVMLPKPTYDYLFSLNPAATHIDAFHQLIMYQLRLNSTQSLEAFRDVREGLENKLKTSTAHDFTYDKLVEFLKSKRYSRTHLQRMLISILLAVKPLQEHPNYIRMLAANKTGLLCLKSMKNSCKRHIVTTPSKIPDEVKNNPHWELDCLATDLYMLVQKNKKGGADYTTPPFILK